MNRLTDKWYVGKNYIPQSCPSVKELYNRLGEYENCELSPTQILLLKDSVKKSVKINDEKSISLRGLTKEQMLLIIQMVGKFKLHNETQEHLKVLNNQEPTQNVTAVA